MRFVRLILLLSGLAPALWGQDPRESRGAAGRVRTQLLAPGPEYEEGGLHRALLGSDYRRLWTTPIAVTVLDLGGYAGGLRATGAGGGNETSTLHLEAPDGRHFSFRSVNKDATRILRAELRNTVIGWVWQDQVSATYPAGTLVVPPLLDAAGVLVSQSQLFVMPNDPALGRFQKRFAGMLGTLEEWPSPGFKGAREVVTTDQLYEILARDPRHQVDSRAFLTARLMDLYLGDSDRGEAQWMWLNRGSSERVRWEPVPVDRDYAFIHFRGLLPTIARIRFPTLVGFGQQYPSMLGLNWRARIVDRRLLGELDLATWDSVAQEVQSRLTDSVIDVAVRRLPQRFVAADGARLTRILRARRDRLPDAARELYQMHAREAEVHGTNTHEIVVATRGPKGTLDVEIRAGHGSAGGAPHFRRRFHARNTKEVRLHTAGGVDTVLVQGADGGPSLRIMGDSGTKVVSDVAEGGRTMVYGRQPVVTPGSRQVPADPRAYQPPNSTSATKAAPRDWGHWWTFSPWLRFGSAYGAFLGVGTTFYDYGFRMDPYAFRLDLRAGYGTSSRAFAGEILGDVRRENSATHLRFRGYGSEDEISHFFGFGNETPRFGSNNFFRVHQQEYELSTGIAWSIGRYLTAEVGPVLKYFSTSFSRAEFIREFRPFGAGKFGEVGAQVAFSLDSRDTAAAATRGVFINVGGQLFPPLWDVASTFGEVHGDAATYLTAPIPLRPTLALRIGGKRLWGAFPFQEAAFIGGHGTVRGLYTDRFQGDASAYANAELRLPVSRFNFLAPGELGVFALTDIGRVWFAGQSSDKWHPTVGGGLWIAYLDRRNTVSIAVARGDNRTALHVATGFLF